MQLVVNGLIAGSLAALMAGGLALVYGVLGIFNFALGQLALTGGYLTWWLHRSAGLPLVPSIIGGVFLAAIITAITFELTVAPFYMREKRLPIVTTIAWSMVLDGLILLIFSEYPRTILSGVKHYLPLTSVRLSIEQLTMILGVMLFLSVLAIILARTSWGRKVRATVQHPHAAESLGVSAFTMHRVVFILSGILAALGGVYVGIDQNLSPTLGFTITIKAYAALIAGGKESLKGTILCAYAIAMLEQFVVGVSWFGFYIPAGYQSTVALLVIIAMLLVRPQGLFGSKVRIA